MAKFRLGQRVRCIGLEGHFLHGAEGIITELNWPSLEYYDGDTPRHWVFFPAYPSSGPHRSWGIFEDQLAPLTDGGFADFMVRVTTPIPELQGLPLELLR